MSGVYVPTTVPEPMRAAVAAWTCTPGCPVAALDAQSGNRPNTMTGHFPYGTVVLNPGRTTSRGYGSSHIGATASPVYSDEGGSSRFFKQVKP